MVVARTVLAKMEKSIEKTAVPINSWGWERETMLISKQCDLSEQ